VAKLVDVSDLGSDAARHGGSSPSTRTGITNKEQGITNKEKGITNKEKGITNKEQGMMNCEVNNTSKLDIPCSSVGYSSRTSEIN
jgi:hypothetical protein